MGQHFERGVLTSEGGEAGDPLAQIAEGLGSLSSAEARGLPRPAAAPFDGGEADPLVGGGDPDVLGRPSARGGPQKVFAGVLAVGTVGGQQPQRALDPVQAGPGAWKVGEHVGGHARTERARVLGAGERSGQGREAAGPFVVELGGLVEVHPSLGDVVVEEGVQAVGGGDQPVAGHVLEGEVGQGGAVQQLEGAVAGERRVVEHRQVRADVGEFHEGVQRGGDPVEPLLQGALDLAELRAQVCAFTAQL